MDEGPMLETLDYTIRIGSTPTFLYFDLYLYSAYAAHFVYNRPCKVYFFSTKRSKNSALLYMQKYNLAANLQKKHCNLTRILRTFS